MYINNVDDVIYFIFTTRLNETNDEGVKFV